MPCPGPVAGGIAAAPLWRAGHALRPQEPADSSSACLIDSRRVGGRLCLPALQQATSNGSPTLRIGATNGASAQAMIRARYELPALQWAQSAFMQPQMMVQDRYFYDPVAGQIHGRPLPRRSGEALRRHRCRADLGDLSEYGHRRPQPAGHGALHARRHRGRCARWWRTSIAAA